MEKQTETTMLFKVLGSGLRVQGLGDLVSRLIMGIIRITIWVIGVINLLIKSPDPPSKFKVELQGGGLCRSHILTPSIPLNKPYPSSLYNPLYNLY